MKYTTNNVFIPFTVGGGVRTISDVDNLLRSGADKVAVNTAAVSRPELLSEIASRFGSQCLVLSVEAKKISEGCWEVYTDNGREKTGKNVLEWVAEATNRGVGEILLTSIDMEGTRRGFDVELTKAVSTSVTVPVIASGGMGSTNDFCDVVDTGKADAVAMADVLHYGRLTIPEIRNVAKAHGCAVRDF